MHIYITLQGSGTHLSEGRERFLRVPQVALHDAKVGGCFCHWTGANAVLEKPFSIVQCALAPVPAQAVTPSAVMGREKTGSCSQHGEAHVRFSVVRVDSGGGFMRLHRLDAGRLRIECIVREK